MTLQECKNEIAKKNVFDDWWSIDFNKTNISQEALRDEAAELYAISKWDEACEAQKQLSVKSIQYLDSSIEARDNVLKSPKPEFK